MSAGVFLLLAVLTALGGKRYFQKMETKIADVV